MSRGKGRSGDGDDGDKIPAAHLASCLAIKAVTGGSEEEIYHVLKANNFDVDLTTNTLIDSTCPAHAPHPFTVEVAGACPPTPNGAFLPAALAEKKLTATQSENLPGVDLEGVRGRDYPREKVSLDGYYASVPTYGPGFFADKALLQ